MIIQLPQDFKVLKGLASVVRLKILDILRKREVSWADIGGALNVSRQAAWERFS